MVLHPWRPAATKLQKREREREHSTAAAAESHIDFRCTVLRNHEQMHWWWCSIFVLVRHRVFMCVCVHDQTRRGNGKSERGEWTWARTAKAKSIFLRRRQAAAAAAGTAAAAWNEQSALRQGRLQQSSFCCSAKRSIDKNKQGIHFSFGPSSSQWNDERTSEQSSSWEKRDKESLSFFTSGGGGGSIIEKAQAVYCSATWILSLLFSFVLRC